MLKIFSLVPEKLEKLEALAVIELGKPGWMLS